jgi:hypothetical protein
VIAEMEAKIRDRIVLMSDDPRAFVPVASDPGSVDVEINVRDLRRWLEMLGRRPNV